LVVSQAVNDTISHISSTVDIANRSVVAAESNQPFASNADRQAYFNASLQLARTQMSASPQRETIVRGRPRTRSTTTRATTHPTAVRTEVHILSTTWAMEGMLDILLRGQGLVAVLPMAGVLMGFAALLFGVGILRFRYE
jgi:hypothetical protein